MQALSRYWDQNEGHSKDEEPKQRVDEQQRCLHILVKMGKIKYA